MSSAPSHSQASSSSAPSVPPTAASDDETAVQRAKALLYFSETLSSLPRHSSTAPPPPLSSPLFSSITSPSSSSSSSGVYDGSSGGLLLSLPSPLLHRLLSLVDSHVFFFVFPRLSSRHCRSFCSSELHRQYGQQRFQLNSRQWRLFTERSYPQLLVPPGKFALHYHRSELIVGFGSSRSQSSSSGPHSDAALTAKDWAMECTHLYQHLTLLTLCITRSIDGGRKQQQCDVRYQLPTVLLSLQVDRLTAHSVSRAVRQLQDESAPLFLYFDYAQFSLRQRPSDELRYTFPAAAAAAVGTVVAAADGGPAGGGDRWLDEVVRLGSILDEPRRECQYGLWYGPALRQALTSSGAAGGSSDSGHRAKDQQREVRTAGRSKADQSELRTSTSTSRRERREVLVDLSHSPLVHYRWVGQSMVARVVADSFDEWLVSEANMQRGSHWERVSEMGSLRQWLTGTEPSADHASSALL